MRDLVVGFVEAMFAVPIVFRVAGGSSFPKRCVEQSVKARGKQGEDPYVNDFRQNARCSLYQQEYASITDVRTGKRDRSIYWMGGFPVPLLFCHCCSIRGFMCKPH